MVSSERFEPDSAPLHVERSNHYTMLRFTGLESHETQDEHVRSLMMFCAAKHFTFEEIQEIFAIKTLKSA